jgi:hypothetical protein
MDREQAARRTRAAVALAGYQKVEELAEALEGSGVGLKRLREIYQQRGNEPRAVEIREIAEATGLPYEFFLVDFATLDGRPDNEDRLAEVEMKQAGIATQVQALTTTVSELTADVRALSRERGSRSQGRSRKKNPPEGQ